MTSLVELYDTLPDGLKTRIRDIVFPLNDLVLLAKHAQLSRDHMTAYRTYVNQLQRLTLQGKLDYIQNNACYAFSSPKARIIDIIGLIDKFKVPRVIMLSYENELLVHVLEANRNSSFDECNNALRAHVLSGGIMFEGKLYDDFNYAVWDSYWTAYVVHHIHMLYFTDDESRQIYKERKKGHIIVHEISYKIMNWILIEYMGAAYRNQGVYYGAMNWIEKHIDSASRQFKAMPNVFEEGISALVAFLRDVPPLLKICVGT